MTLFSAIFLVLGEFDATQHTFRYASVLEIPTARWSTYDAAKNNLPVLKDGPAIIPRTHLVLAELG
ncbi:MAG: hypothetical protein ACI92Z_000723 [Paracoccaceae bacterium]